MTARSATAPLPPVMTVGFVGWLRKNLFSTWRNSVVTVVLGVLLAWMVVNLGSWVIVEADWTVIISRVPLYIVGLYPYEGYWRLAICLLLISVLMGMAWRSWPNAARRFAFAFGAIMLFVGVFPHEMATLHRVMLLLNLPAIGLGYVLTPSATQASPKRLESIAGGRLADVLDRIAILSTPRRMLAAVVVVLVITIILILGIGGVPGLDPVNPQDLGGLMLNLLLAFFGIVCSLPIGIALALGRRSSLPVVKVACVAFIEVIRGVPLITLLFMSRHILPLTFPADLNVDRVYLAGITITIFSSAYMAENVRGGMAAVHTGQAEAARALGLRGWQTTLMITLPQGLRNIIPAIVGQFISLFKDTSLVSFIGMLDLVEMGRVSIQGNQEFIDNGREVYLFLALVFWVFTFSMSFISRRIEHALGVGRR